MRAVRHIAAAEGFTLIEVLVAAFVLLVGVLGTVTMLDGPQDGTSGTPPANACRGAVASNPPDSNPDDFRRVDVSISWTLQGVTRTVDHCARIVNPSGSLEPSIT